MTTVQKWWPWVRRTLAFVVLVVTTVVVVASYFPNSGVKSCHQELAQTGAVVSVCGPIGLADVIGVSMVLVLGLLLLWPDLSEVTVFNLVGVKRRVDEVERRTDKAGDDIRALNLSQPPVDEGVMNLVFEAVREAVRAEAPAATGEGTANDAEVVVVQNGRTLSGRRAAQEAEALKVAQSLDRFLRVVDTSTDSGLEAKQLQGDQLIPPTMHPNHAAKRIIMWAVESDAYLRQWSALRNNLVHSPERLSDEEVELALQLGRSLILRLQHDLNRFT